MRYKLSPGIALAALLFLSAHPAVAASFTLPDDMVIAIGEFTFPASPTSLSPTSFGGAEEDFPAAFHAHLTAALQKAGFSISREENATSPDTLNQDAPLTVTPLAEESSQGKAAADEALPPLETDAPESPEEPEAFEYAGADAAAEADATAQREETTPELGEAEPPAIRGGATHILTGTVTFQETAGTPNRIAGSIRVRVTARARCAYTIRDAATGKTLLTDISSGSSASLAREDNRGILNVVRSRAMTAAAETIAARLSGTDNPEDGTQSDRQYYQDSPGKRLKTQ